MDDGTDPAEWPRGITPRMTRPQVRQALGTPERSGEPGGTGPMAVEFAWDRFAQPDASVLRVEYGADGASVRSVTVQPAEENDPFMVELSVYADYYQFYVKDTASTCDTSVIWDDPVTTEHGFAVGDGLVAVGTKRYEHVPVRVEVYATDPGFEWAGLDRINEGGLVVTERFGVGMPISDPDLQIVGGVTPGTYAVRSMATRLDTVVDDWHGDDLYIVQLWPVDHLPPTRYRDPLTGEAGGRHRPTPAG